MLGAKYTFEAIGTQWSIETDRPVSKGLSVRISEYIAGFAAVYSRFDTHSTVYQMFKSPDESFEFPSSLRTLLGVYTSLHTVSDGKIHPLVGGSLEQLGYGAGYSLQPKGDPVAAPPLDTLKVTGSRATLTMPALLDIGAIGKGYVIDEIARMVETEHAEYVIDGSGDLRIHTNEPQRIGLEDPRDISKVIGFVDLTHKSLCASATNRRAWAEGLHHVIDATTGAPAETDVVATWAVANDAVIADALTTGLFFVSPEVLMDTFGSFNYAILYKDGHVYHNLESIGELYA